MSWQVYPSLAVPVSHLATSAAMGAGRPAEPATDLLAAQGMAPDDDVQMPLR